MITAAAPFLMFQGRCEEALTFYAATLPGCRIVSVDRKPDGTVAMARLSIGGLEILANDSPPVHDFDFTPSTSTFVTVDSADEVDRLTAALGEDGKVLRLLAAVRLGAGPVRRLLADQPDLNTAAWTASA